MNRGDAPTYRYTIRTPLPEVRWYALVHEEWPARDALPTIDPECEA